MSLLTAARPLLCRRGRAQDHRGARVGRVVARAEDCARRLLSRQQRRRRRWPSAKCEAPSTSRARTIWTCASPSRGRARRRWCSTAAYLQRLAGRAMAGIVLTATGARTLPGPEGAAPGRRRVRGSDNRRGRDAGDAAVARIPALRAAGRRAHPDRLRSLAVPVRPARRLPASRAPPRPSSPASPSPIGDTGAGGAARRDAVAAVVEPLIAASIVLVGVENVDTRRRAGPGGGSNAGGLAFAFGLVHGLGFAGALADIGLGARRRASIVAPLVAFNLGIELGQLPSRCRAVRGDVEAARAAGVRARRDESSVAAHRCRRLVWLIHG